MQACDSCRIRRTKCDRGNPCSRCRKSELECEYRFQPKKRGPEGRTIARIKSRQRVKDRTPFNTIIAPPCQVPHIQAQFMDLLSPYLPSLIQTYFQQIHPLSPIVNHIGILTRLSQQEHLYDPALASMVLSMASLPLILPGSESVARSRDMIKASKELYSTLDESCPTLDSLAAAALLSSYTRIMESPQAAHLKSKHMIGLIELMRLDRLDGYDNLSLVEKEAAISIYWNVGIGERSNALLLNLAPLSFRHDLLPFELPASSLALRLEPCMRVFSCLSSEMIDCINNRCSRLNLFNPDSSCCTTQEDIIAIHAALDAVRLDHQLSQVQMTDVLLTRQYIHCKLWQASVSHSLLSHSPYVDFLGMDYPLNLLMEVRTILGIYPDQAVEGNGQAMGYKLGTIVDTARLVLDLLQQPTPFFSREHALNVLEEVNEVATSVKGKLWHRINI